MKITAIYDNGGETIDRYTIVFNEQEYSDQLVECLGLSDNPEHPQGFSQFSGCQDGPHLGKQIHFEDLPSNIQQHIHNRLGD